MRARGCKYIRNMKHKALGQSIEQTFKIYSQKLSPTMQSCSHPCNQFGSCVHGNNIFCFLREIYGRFWNFFNNVSAVWKGCNKAFIDTWGNVVSEIKKCVLALRQHLRWYHIFNYVDLRNYFLSKYNHSGRINVKLLTAVLLPLKFHL